jgi:endonuclease/exonuclease/phosphatase family metal-dependent hydrolase
MIRVLTYNVRSLRDDATAVARVIRSAHADVVCVQEAPRFLRWRAKCTRLARRSGLRIIGGGRVAGANLLLAAATIEIAATRDVLLSRNRGYHQRGVAMAVLRLEGSTVAVAGTHLDGQSQPHQIAELHSALDAFAPGIPAIVGGDINAVPGSPAWDSLTARGTDAFAVAGTGDGFTSNIAAPTRRIDAIVADPPLVVRAAQVVDTPDVRIASDHFPVLAELDLPPRSA